ncbi:hypothetical protein CPB83DRAFT_848883 [Crepidotus variabilis]|uniref:DUF6533 domain-containing protein n=1 Tax=Crepidotus variabilis TaxID=179855 RepID=A0A9P6ELJ9_9AGAR|nr:hypothetical protein CPB83DRAFT_848883 [Crepidotus variabilis]
MPTMSSIPAPGMDAVSPLLAMTDPSLARQLNIATYIHIGATAVLVWDVINNLGNEYRLMFRYKVRVPAFIYFCARIALTTYMIGRSVFLTAPIPRCQEFLTFLSVALVLNVSAITSLFTLRLCAVYNMHKLILILYGILWLAGIGLMARFVEAFRAVPIGESGFCLEVVNGSFLAPLLTALLFNDTLIFVLITYRVYMMYLKSGAPISRRLSLFCFGTSLPLLTKALLQDSQLYCLVSVLSKALSTYFAYKYQGPLQMFVVVHMVIANILCGKIYRKIRMSPNLHVLPTQTTNLNSMEFRSRSTNGKDITASMPVFLHGPRGTLLESNPRMYSTQLGIPSPMEPAQFEKSGLGSNSTIEEDITDCTEPSPRAI